MQGTGRPCLRDYLLWSIGLIYQRQLEVVQREGGQTLSSEGLFFFGGYGRWKVLSELKAAAILTVYWEIQCLQPYKAVVGATGKERTRRSVEYVLVKLIKLADSVVVLNIRKIEGPN
jgi:hypothetical protein